MQHCPIFHKTSEKSLKFWVGGCRGALNSLTELSLKNGKTSLELEDWKYFRSLTLPFIYCVIKTN